ncbi:TonB-dependent receptor [Aquimarina pacifica]|uniref:TonB-dependent receptor n=1 Tax=Aquimarina pacifica TaxID=1296415 RepID=UPI00046E550C|nr:TonB-dependent receptor plug domain-containing protein [Aquimarina pacifica]
MNHILRIVKTRVLKCILGITALLFNFTAFSQNQVIKGIIYDSFETPLEGVYVYNTTTELHTHSLENGTFSLPQCTIKDTLFIKLLGFETQKKIINQQDVTSVLKVILKPKVFQLDELILKQEIDPMSVINTIDSKTNPVNSSQEVLRKVPGLFIGQHGGGGKAEQIFLRGFDVDHGTDIAISVNGIPVNMVSHAHGQGYADLHFIIPETIKKVNFGKGPHYAEQGNFNTAGYVAFDTKEKFDTNLLKIELGDFNTYRTLGLFNLLDDSSKEKAILALEYLESDGPFESHQNFNRINLSTKYTTLLSDDNKLSIGASHFSSRWDASGQIPERAVDSGFISRFGAIDDTEGGNTSRTNLYINHHKFLSDNSILKTNAFYTNYDFELYSNFTFFLNDPVNGDQIKQYEARDIFGFNSTMNTKTTVGNAKIDYNLGLGVRNDQINDNELSRTLNRSDVLEIISLGTVNETNIYGFIDATLSYNKLKITPSIRFDYFKNLYEDNLEETYETQDIKKAIVSPKLKLSYDFGDNITTFIKSGIGFHSNDTRVVVAAGGEDILPRAYGLDIGINWKPFPRVFLNTTAWYLGLDQEFVYVGDEGIIEPSGKTKRLGIDLSGRYQLNDWLFFDSDFTYTDAKSVDEPGGQDYIPLAPELTAAGGISIDNINNFSGGLRYRYLGDRAANEDNSITAEGYTVLDANLSYTIKKITLGLSVENLLDTEWNEAQFATESRLFNETESVEEIHFTPGTPFFIKGKVSIEF